MEAQETGDFSDLFINEEELNDVGEETSDKVVHPLLGELPEINIDDGKINWMQVLDPDGSVVEANKKKAMGITDVEDLELFNLGEKRYLDTPDISLASLEDLAASAGVSLDDVKSADSHVVQQEDMNIPNILSENEIENTNIMNQDLVSDIMDGVVFETENIEDIEIFEDEEMEFVEDLDIYRNKNTGEIYEAVEEDEEISSERVGENKTNESVLSDAGGDSFEEE